MALMSLNNIALSFGDPPLLTRVSLQIEPGERVCLLGRNGAGKSTMMKLMAGEVLPDAGEVIRQKNTRVAMLGQDIPAGLTGTVRTVVSECVPKTLTGPPIVDVVLTRMSLNPEVPFQTLSVGLKRRTLLARALAAAPDLLLLDEPTNHLDIDAITWLEAFLLKQRSALFFVTHDRTLTQRLATRIVELDRGGVSSWACDYQTYLKRREAQLEAEGTAQDQFDRRLSEEEAWIRQGIRARRTRNEGRVRALKEMRVERQKRRTETGKARVVAQEAERSSRLVIEAEEISFAYSDKTVIDRFSTTILRGDKIGLIGPNGVGKTTLLRLLLGEMAPQSGSVKHGMRLQVAYFDQLRAQLDDNKTVFDTVANGSDRVTFNGQNRHVFAYLQDFLFDPARARSLVKVLSGGERNRLLLAKLFTLPANVLALDEPTNDLDTETLDVLESVLVSFSGTVLLVSHDRSFLNNVVTSSIVFEDGLVREYVGGYDEWLRQRPVAAVESALDKPRKQKTTREPVRKLTFGEKRELEVLPQQIEDFETERQALHEQLSDPATYQNGRGIGSLKERLETVEEALEAGYERWSFLEEIREGKTAAPR
jgi:ABC transport system ATP-binding/permease protein